MTSIQIRVASKNSIGVSPGLLSFIQQSLGLRAGRVVALATHSEPLAGGPTSVHNAPVHFRGLLWVTLNPFLELLEKRKTMGTTIP